MSSREERFFLVLRSAECALDAAERVADDEVAR